MPNILNGIKENVVCNSIDPKQTIIAVDLAYQVIRFVNAQATEDWTDAEVERCALISLSRYIQFFEDQGYEVELYLEGFRPAEKRKNVGAATATRLVTRNVLYKVAVDLANVFHCVTVIQSASEADSQILYNATHGGSGKNGMRPTLVWSKDSDYPSLSMGTFTYEELNNIILLLEVDIERCKFIIVKTSVLYTKMQEICGSMRARFGFEMLHLVWEVAGNDYSTVHCKNVGIMSALKALFRMKQSTSADVIEGALIGLGFNIEEAKIAMEESKLYKKMCVFSDIGTVVTLWGDDGVLGVGGMQLSIIFFILILLGNFYTSQELARGVYRLELEPTKHFPPHVTALPIFDETTDDESQEDLNADDEFPAIEFPATGEYIFMTGTEFNSLVAGVKKYQIAYHNTHYAKVGSFKEHPDQITRGDGTLLKNGGLHCATCNKHSVAEKKKQNGKRLFQSQLWLVYIETEVQSKC